MHLVLERILETDKGKAVVPSHDAESAMHRRDTQSSSK